jgi:hypothetical protein
MINSRLNLGDSSLIQTPILSLSITKLMSSSLGPDLKQGASSIVLPSFCDLTNSKPVIVNATNPTYTPASDPNACNSKEISTVVSQNFIYLEMYFRLFID